MRRVSIGWSRSVAIAFTTICLMAIGTAALRAQEQGAADSAAAPAAPLFSLNGFVSAAYSYNAGRPSSGMNTLRVFDFDDNDFKIDVAEIVLQRAVEHGGDAGFRVDLEAGASIPRVSASSGLFRSVGKGPEDIDLQQAFVSWIAPVGSGLRFDFGKFITMVGYEVIDGYDGYNDNASRSFLFGYAIPFTHTGLRLTYGTGSWLSATAMVVNGWDVVADNNRAKSIGAQITLVPLQGMSFCLGYIGGAERDTNNADMRHLFDVVGSWKLTDRFTIGGNADYGMERSLVTPGKNAVWRGVAGYVKLALSEPFSLALRGEAFQDRNGVRTGTKQILKELTLTPEYHMTRNIAVRADLRLDLSDKDVFDDDGTAANRQPTVLLNALYVF